MHQHAVKAGAIGTHLVAAAAALQTGQACIVAAASPQQATSAYPELAAAGSIPTLFVAQGSGETTPVLRSFSPLTSMKRVTATMRGLAAGVPPPLLGVIEQAYCRLPQP